nr:hypothetical protein [uncultured Actinoplanes sp.]
MNAVDFPEDVHGRRSSAAFGRAVVADALRVADPVAAEAAAAERDWRKGYPRHFRALVAAGLGGRAYEIARAGLASVRERIPVDLSGHQRPLETVTVAGSGRPETEVTLPHRGELLRGDRLLRQLDAWVAGGAIEPSCADAVRDVVNNPSWLDLSDSRFVALGAGAEMGPVPAILGWGGTVIGVDRPPVQQRVVEAARTNAGRLIVPGDGVDLLTDLPAVARWLDGIDGRLIVGTYVYAPGGLHTRLSIAVDALSGYLTGRRPDTALAFLATPTDVFAVPADAVRQANDRYRARSRTARVTGSLSGGRLLHRNYPEGADPGINDSIVVQQGPNYALAKRIQRWRATVARHERTVAFAVAPPTRTRSVTSNRLLAAAYAGAHRFDVEVFEPRTANKLMALVLVHQVRNPRPPAGAAWQDEAFAAAHGGLWRTAYRPRTALPLAVLLPR